MRRQKQVEGFTLIETLGFLGTLSLFFLVLTGLCQTLIKEMPRQQRMVEYYQSTSRAVDAVQKDCHEAKSVKMVPDGFHLVMPDDSMITYLVSDESFVRTFPDHDDQKVWSLKGVTLNFEMIQRGDRSLLHLSTCQVRYYNDTKIKHFEMDRLMTIGLLTTANHQEKL